MRRYQNAQTKDPNHIQIGDPDPGAVCEWVYWLTSNGREDEASDHLYDVLLELESDADYERARKILASIDPSKLYLDTIASVLSATSPHSGYLPERKDFLKRCLDSVGDDKDKKKKILSYS